MTKEEAIKALQDIVNGDWDSQSAGAIQYAIDALSQASLPSDLDEAAKGKAREIFDAHEKYDIGEEKNRILLGLLELEAFAVVFYDNGAEWMAGQGYTKETKVDRTPLNGPPGICLNLHEYDGFKLGDKVIVQIRKKE